ncbi:hypothetical protein BVY04_00845 [bacterium M21]|nr:hypothetical protein BVY04_00845 [bacterium M21]
MASLNKVILAGNLTREPEGRRTSSGTSLCNLGLAVNRRYRNSAGEYTDETTFVDIDVWGQPADFCRDYLHKGNAVLIEGRLRLDSWEDNATGQKRSKLKVVAERVQSLTPRSEGSGAPQPQGGGYQQQAPAPQQGGYQQPQQQPYAQPQAPAPAPAPAPQQGYQQPQAPTPPPFPVDNPAPAAPGAAPAAPAAPAAGGDAFDVSDESIDDIPF